jgi:pimeloyl-ACP methyl ester carboxylesterase
MPVGRRLAVFVAGAALLLFAACSDRDDSGEGAPAAASPTETPTSFLPTATPVAGTPTTAGPTPGISNVFPAPQLEKQLGSSNGGEFIIADPVFEALPGATAHFGQLGDAGFRIEMPDAWNGSLVLYAHGVRLFTNRLEVSNPLGPLRQRFIDQGFAWAASSYSETFYVPGIGADDTMALLQHFRDQFGEPERVYLVGESMGGHAVTLLMEHYPETWAGALGLCPAIGGQEQIDYLLGWTVAAEFASGVELPIGLPIPDPTGIATALLRALGPPDVPTQQGLQFAGIVRELSGGPRPFFAEGLIAQYEFNFGLLLVDPERKTWAVAAASNLEARYTISEGLGLTGDAVDAGVRRLGPVDGARDAEAHPDSVPTTGAIERPFLTLHNTGDLFVPIGQEAAYRAKAEALGRGELLVQRAIRAPGHCRFSEAELMAAWDDLVAWVEAGSKPAGDDLSGDLMEVGRQFTNPVRAGDPGTP